MMKSHLAACNELNDVLPARRTGKGGVQQSQAAHRQDLRLDGSSSRCRGSTTINIICVLMAGCRQLTPTRV